MINWLKPELSNLGPSYEILTALAENPCSLRLCTGQSWKEIEEDLYGTYAKGGDAGPLSDGDLRQVIDLSEVVDCPHLDVWIEEVAAYLGQPPDLVSAAVHALIETRGFRWSDPIGALITA